MLGFDDYPDIAAKLRRHPGRRAAPPAHAAGPPQAAADLAGRPADAERAWSCPGHTIAAPDLPAGAGPRLRPARRTPPPRRRPDGPAEAGQRLRPALLVLRDPVASAAPSSPAAPPTCSARPAGSASRASRSCSWSARTPRPTARTSATCGCSRRCCPSWPPSTASSGSGSPTCSPPRRAPAWSARSPAPPGVAPLLRPVLPARRPPTVLRRMRRFGDPDSFLALLEQIRGAGPAAGVRSNVIVGFPGETEEDLRDPVRLPRGGPARRGRRLRLLRRGRHRGRVVRRQARRGRDPRPHRARHAAGRGAHRAARRGPDRRARRTCSWSRVDGGTAEGRAAHQGPEVDGTTTC